MNILGLNKSIRIQTVFHQDELDYFSNISGDHNPIHTPQIYETNPEYKGGVIVQGMLAASRFGSILGTDFPGAGTINVERSFKFLRTVYVDTPYQMELNLTSVDVDKNAATLLLNMYSEEGHLCISGRTEIINEKVFTIENYPKDNCITKNYHEWGGKKIKLPTPKDNSTMTLSEALNKRRSVRLFYPTPIDEQELSNILQAAGGVTKVSEGETGKKYLFTNPTASNHQEVEIYLFKEDGVFFYDPIYHCLEQVSKDDYRKDLGKLPFFKKAPVSLCLVSNLDKMVHHTDDVRRDLYSSMDIGYVSQNIYLYCAAHNLATVACGMIDKKRISEILSLSNEKVMLVHPIGVRKKKD